MTKRHRERGVALFVAMFAMMLLAAIGVAMLYASDSETSVAANFRDQQTAIYAALAGAQEGRERLRSGAVGHIAFPNGLPSTTATNIVYIINPRAGETIQPWNPNNPYYDWELCRERMPNNLCSGGTPPASGWYTVINDTDSTYGGVANVWKRSTPLNFKWIRINLKSNDMIPGFETDGQTGTNGGKLVCWDVAGRGQITLPAGYLNTCFPNGSVASIQAPATAIGYSSAPTVTIQAPPAGGTQAIAQAIIDSPPDAGEVTAVTITNAGTKYTSAPTVTLVGGGFTTQATATATIIPWSSDGVMSATATPASAPDEACYETSGASTVNFTGGGGTGAVGQATMSGKACIARLVVTGTCTNNSDKNKTYTISATNGSGSGFAATIKVANGNSGTLTATVTHPGSGYSTTPTTFSKPSNTCTPNISAVPGYHLNSSISITNKGNSFTSAPTPVLTISKSAGTDPTLSSTIGGGNSNSGKVTSIDITYPGSGYTSAPTVQLTGGGFATAATAVATISKSGTITGFTFDCSGCSHGSGYTEPPSVTIAGGGGPTMTTSSSLSGAVYYGKVAEVTAFAETPTFGNRRGSQAVVQLEVASLQQQPAKFSIGGAITLPGPDANFGTPNSNNFYVKGTDANTCGGTRTDKPSIAVFDPDNASAVSDLIADLSRPDHYPGLHPSPDVERINSSDLTPEDLEAFVSQLRGMAQNATPSHYYSGSTTLSGNAKLNPTNPGITFVEGNASLQAQAGSGILVVTGALTFGGNYSWDGLILVIGQGQATYNGGGNGQVNGSVYVAKTRDSSGNLLDSLGQPTLDYSGGGGNGVQYDHCKADALLGQIPTPPPTPPTTPLLVLSQKVITK